MMNQYHPTNGYIRGTFTGRMTPVVKMIIISSCVIFICQLILEKLGLDISLLFGLVPKAVTSQLFLWQFVTYLFLHGSLMHLVFNMFVLWMLGGEIEKNVFWKKEFLKYYFICGVGAAIFNVIFSYGSKVPIIGSSGAIYGILVAYAIFFGNRPLVLFPFPVLVQAKYFVLIILLIELVSSIFYTTDGIAHLAHLGGMVAGYLYISYKIHGPKQMWQMWLFRSTKKKPKFKIIDGGQA